MAVDSMLFAVQVPAGTYAAGDSIPAKLIRGPSVVRDGYGEAKMKRVFVCASGATGTLGVGHVTVKNQNWIDYMASIVSTAAGNAGQVVMNTNSTGVQRCGDISLQPNTAFEVNYIIDEAKTTTTAYDVFVLIDIDYPSVQAVQNPKEESGAPVTIMREDTITTTVIGASHSATWTSINVDIFKAGFRYLLAELGTRHVTSITNTYLGFFIVSGAAGQNGLARIIPIIPGNTGALRWDIDYSTPLVKGPMELSYMCMSDTVQTGNIVTEMDFIRR